MIRSTGQITAAIIEWKKIDGLKFIDVGEANADLKNTIGSHRKILGILKPSNQNQIGPIVKIADHFNVPLYTVSTGQNWGYGSSLPAIDACMILNLSELKKILAFDVQLGSVVVEPGVTQQQLHDYLTKHELPFMVPTTGAGPTCSLLGNALEKGYGINPHEDHFGSILGLKAILADGSLYQSALYEMGGHRADAVFKWKLGPYLEGLFAQGSFGIVTQVTIALARRPENITQFLAFIDDENFEEGVIAVQNIKQKLGSLVGGVNLMNNRRLLAMVEKPEVWKLDQILPEMQVRKLAKKRKLPEWAMLGGLYGPNELTEAAQEIIRNELRPFARRILFLSRRKITWAQKFAKYFSFNSFLRTLNGISEALNILEGIPSRVALPLAYLKNRVRPSENKELSPDKDSCGIIWFSPILPMDPALARDFTQEVTRVCIAEGIEPLITLTGFSERCFDSTIPLVFDASSESEVKKARDCYDALIEVAQEFGIFPYRLDVDGMRKYYKDLDFVSLKFANVLKVAADPKGILSPGRYDFSDSK